MDQNLKHNFQSNFQEEAKSVLEELFEYFPDPIFMYDNNDYLLYANKTCSECHDIPRSNLIGKHITEIFSKDVAELYIEEHKIVKDSLKEKISEYEIEGEDGNAIITYNYVKPFITKENKILGVIGISRNITDLKKLEAIRRNQDKNLKLANDILMNAPDLIFFVDKENKYQLANKKFVQMVNLPLEEILGKTNSELYEPKIANMFDKFNKQVCEKLQEISHESDMIMNDKRVIVKTNKRPFFDDNNVFQGIIGIGREITKERLLEERYFANQRIESLAYLANTFSHDFNNLLGAVSGYTDILLEKETNPEKKLYLERIVATIHKADELTKQIMYLSDFGKINNEFIEINEILTEIVSMARHSTSQNIQFNIELEKKLFPISGDYNQIFQVLMNIITNAVESMPEGGKISIKTKNQEINLEKSEFVMIEITDMGIGISKEDLTKIFDPFFSTKGPTVKHSVRGLGLSMVHRIIQNHNGTIEVISVVDQGTTFRIYLPKNLTLPASPSSKSTQTLKKKTSKTLVKKRKKSKTGTKKRKLVLVIEDNSDLLEIMKIRFDKEKINGLYTEYPLEGIELFKKHRNNIDLVVLDYIMPEMTGLEVYSILKEIQKDVKVVLVTGYAKNAIKSKDIGILEIMSKPLNYDSFLSKITAIMN